MIKKFIRGIITLCGGLLGYGVSYLFRGLIIVTNLGEVIVLTETQKNILSTACAFLSAIIFFTIAPTIGKHSQKVARNIESDLQKVPSTDIIPGTFGLVVGVFLAYLISQLYMGIQLPYIAWVLSVLTYLLLGYIGVFVATKRGREILAIFSSARKGTPGPKGKKTGDAAPKILDTSVIIDGRISDIMKTGFIEGNIVIPEFVLVELRHIADSSDNLKRNRGRRGLDVLNKIQTDYGIEIYNTDGDKTIEEIPEVDVKLLKLAQNLGGKVMTNDYNLNKVAVIKGVEVLNINELANMLKPVVLPGEEMELFLVKEGKESNQAVAYLDDGTMIVVEEGKRYIGQSIIVVVTSVLQTAAGRMIFGKPKKGK
ncbi:MAG TPA: PIN/TRAM domain-containing protein [Anaerovoracaceae bacterium]|nr:PIN/TRAM domain-containing protein [Anaerovoracaceae bacterium]